VLAAGPQPAVKIEAQALSSKVSLAQGKQQEALAAAAAGVAGAEAVGPESSELILPLLAQGDALLALGKPKDAVAPLERALTVAQKTQAWPVHLAQVQLSLAQALAKDDPARAKTLAQAAQQTFAAAPGQQAEAQRAAGVLKAL